METWSPAFFEDEHVALTDDDLEERSAETWSPVTNDVRYTVDCGENIAMRTALRSGHPHRVNGMTVHTLHARKSLLLRRQGHRRIKGINNNNNRTIAEAHVHVAVSP